MSMVILITDDEEKPVWIWPGATLTEIELSVCVGVGPAYNLTGREFADRIQTADDPPRERDGSSVEGSG